MTEIKMNELVKLVEEYGEDMTIGQIVKEQGKPYKCPLCMGAGKLGVRIYTKEEPLAAIKGHNAPLLTHLLQSHSNSFGDCKLCDNEGYLDEDLIPVETPVVTGYMQRPMK